MKTILGSIAMLSCSSLLCIPLSLLAESRSGGSIVDKPVKIPAGKGWIKINSVPINLGLTATTCTATASASMSVSRGIGGVYSLGYGIDNNAPEAAKGCISSSRMLPREVQQITSVCVFGDLSGSHQISLYARPEVKRASKAVVDRNSMILNCSERDLGDSDGATASQTINVINKIGSTQTFYIGFNNNTVPYGNAFWTDQGCSFNTSNPYVCSFTLNSGATQIFSNITNGTNIAISAGTMVWSTCGGGTGLTMAELNLNTTPYHQDYYDISLVNGFNFPVTIAPLSSANPSTPAPYSTTINVNALTGNSATPGVYGAGMTNCTYSSNPPTGPGCPSSSYPGEAHATNSCQAAQPASYPTVPIYNITFGSS